MRWCWIDKFTEIERGKRCVAVKCTSLGEDHIHDLYKAYPIMPHSIITEGMAQTAGMLVGDANDFREKVILAKITRATFHRLIRPGDTIEYHAQIDQMDAAGASTSGKVICNGTLTAEIEIMFSHIDQNMKGMKFPEHNFVFTDEFKRIMNKARSDVVVGI
jgi:3-hydroxyacyl-[acyl-carrier-protein] dehydratase